jgi:hypothetical protein
MTTADEDCANACGYIEDREVADTAAFQTHRPRKGSDSSVPQAAVGVVLKRRFCVLKAGHAGGHSFRTQ